MIPKGTRVWLIFPTVLDSRKIGKLDLKYTEPWEGEIEDFLNQREQGTWYMIKRLDGVSIYLTQKEAIYAYLSYLQEDFKEITTQYFWYLDQMRKWKQGESDDQFRENYHRVGGFLDWNLDFSPSFLALLDLLWSRKSVFFLPPGTLPSNSIRPLFWPVCEISCGYQT